MAARRAKHGTTGSGYAFTVEKEDGSGRTAVWPSVSSSIAPGDRVHAVPALEVTTTVGWCGHARRARRGGAVVGGARRGGGEEG
jgi:hypothetical protein